MTTKKNTKRQMAKEIDTSDKPFVENYPLLRDWLVEHGGRCAWQHFNGRGRQATSSVEGWLVNGRVVVVIVHANRMGWELLTAADTVSIDKTLADADVRVGLTTKRALDALAEAEHEESTADAKGSRHD